MYNIHTAGQIFKESFETFFYFAKTLLCLSFCSEYERILSGSLLYSLQARFKKLLCVLLLSAFGTSKFCCYQMLLQLLLPDITTRRLFRLRGSIPFTALKHLRRNSIRKDHTLCDIGRCSNTRYSGVTRNTKFSQQNEDLQPLPFLQHPGNSQGVHTTKS